ncbi:Hypothetical protein CINCED_3A024947 [Cinara cedri]|uniref:Uncharacterized protein n=1 Tax=Cinara cedri TaxID=506608 RepID=A0A5E4MH87_9HEMI|nr:Hypothetical protein CINCED_3A024947 [Cinara cedri]
MSARCIKVDIELNKSMRIISGTVRTTQIQWLPVLANIIPPELRKLRKAHQEVTKVTNNPELPLYNDIVLHPPKKIEVKTPYLGLEISDKINIQDMEKSLERFRSTKLNID